MNKNLVCLLHPVFWLHELINARASIEGQVLRQLVEWLTCRIGRRFCVAKTVRCNPPNLLIAFLTGRLTFNSLGSFGRDQRDKLNAS